MKFLISAGPTQEKIDPVRFITNHSSGKMGYALAQVAHELGHDVTLVSGPVTIAPPDKVKMVRVKSAAEMAAAMKSAAVDADVVISCAAVADYRPVVIHDQKMKKSDDKLIIEMERTEDILASLGKVKPTQQILVGFAAETNDLIANAQGKLERKNLDWIVANKVGEPGQGFGVDQNAATLISRDGKQIALPLQSKVDLARGIIARILS